MVGRKEGKNEEKRGERKQEREGGKDRRKEGIERERRRGEKGKESILHLSAQLIYGKTEPFG